MNGISLTLLGIALFLTLGVLFVGIFAMARGGEFSKKYSNRLMRYRIIFQSIALLFFAVAMMTRD